MVHRGALILIAGLLLGACGGSVPEPTPGVAGVSGVAELVGPYQANPFLAFDPALVELLSNSCREDSAGDARSLPALEVALVDARGRGRFMVLMAAQDGRFADCVGSLDASGAPSIDEGTSGNGGGIVVGPHELLPGSGGMNSGPDAWSWVTGDVGPEIGGVVLELADGSRITASVGGGRYAAWWPGDRQSARILAYDRNGDFVGETPP